MSVIWRKNEKITTKTKMNSSFSEENQFRSSFRNELDQRLAKERRKQKRFRSAFTTTQVAIMEQEFSKSPYVTNMQREQMANTLHLPERAIKIWFQNRRMKEKRDPSKIVEPEVIPKNSCTTATNEHSRTIITPEPTPTITKIKSQHEEDSHVRETENIKQREHPETNLLLSNGDLIISKIDNHKTQDEQKVVYNYSSAGNVCEVDMKPVDLMNKVPVDRSVPQKQPVCHILPFSQGTSVPQRSPENLTLKKDKEPSANEPKETETTQSQHTGYFPLNLTKYYTPVPPINAWNRLNFIPLMPGAPPGIHLSSNPSVPTDTPPSLNPSKCCCDCHSSLGSLDAPRLHAPYPFVYTQYIPHIMASLPSQYPNTKY